MKGFNWLKTGLVTVAITAAMSVSSFAAIADTGYGDVAADAWYADSVAYCSEQGIMNGTGEYQFSPDGQTTRAMIASILYRLQDSPTVEGHGTFSDVLESSWYSDAVIWALENNIMSGYSQTQFGPNDAVTREQFASILWRTEGAPAGAEETSFSDSGQIASYAKQAVAWARENGIISGKEGNRFDPKGIATRAEISSMIYRWLNPSGNMNTPAEDEPEEAPENDTDILIAYFSHTGNTEGVAEVLADMTGGDLFEIIPVEDYPTDYNACLEQAQQELNDNARPAISNTVENMDQYEVVMIGFPIWYGDTPMIVQTFLESYDFDGKRIAPFSTSGSSGIGGAVNSIEAICPSSEVLEGLAVTSGNLNRAEELASEWLSEIGFHFSEELDEVLNESQQMEITFGDTVLYAQVENNVTANDFLSSLPVNLEFEDYNNTEKISYLSEELQVEVNRTAYQPQPGDLCYYVPWGNLCLFYGNANASSDLVPIAHLTSGVEQIEQIENGTVISMR